MHGIWISYHVNQKGTTFLEGNRCACEKEGKLKSVFQHMTIYNGFAGVFTRIQSDVGTAKKYQILNRNQNCINCKKFCYFFLLSGPYHKHRLQSA